MEGEMMRTQVKSLTMKMKWTLGRIGRMQKKKREEGKCLFEASVDHGFEKGILKLKVQCYSKMNGKAV
eukprot:11053848-Ditylum_brightwellii.AAC.1